MLSAAASANFAFLQYITTNATTKHRVAVVYTRLKVILEMTVASLTGFYSTCSHGCDNIMSVPDIIDLHSLGKTNCINLSVW